MQSDHPAMLSVVVTNAKVAFPARICNNALKVYDLFFLSLTLTVPVTTIDAL